jgi:hypothetical protein
MHFIVSVGRFLGVGEKDVAVPFNAIRATQKDRWAAFFGSHWIAGASSRANTLTRCALSPLDLAKQC